jgi:CHAD domain-containing protein
MDETSNCASLDSATLERSLTLGKFAHQIIEQQYQRIVKQDRKVLADKDPEHVHQMRVGIRRLRTALEVFGQAVDLPEAAHDKRLREVARQLGALRDLDVQMATLKEDYQPRLNPTEQALINDGLTTLEKRRRKIFDKTKKRLTRLPYQNLKATYETWLNQPHYKPIANLSLLLLLPDLIHPLLSTLLLHPAWLISNDQISSKNSSLLHDLRKLCKRVRYQAEFFADFYGEAFQSWIEEVKDLQERLGKLQDSQVLSDLLADTLPRSTELPELQTTLEQERNDALSNWDEIRQKYLNSEFRCHLHQLVLKPVANDRLATS